jgi:hypothetical protein
MSDKEKAESSAETEEIAPTEETAIATETPAETGETGESTEREKIYANYAKEEYEAEKSESEEEKPEGEPEKKEEELKEKSKEKSEEKTKTEDKTVPLGALHEERQKRKESQAKVVELEQQVKELAQQVKSKPKEEGEEEYIEDYDAELIKLRKDNESLRKKVDGIEAKGTQSEAEKAQTAFLAKVDKVGKELTEEGFNGFSDCTPMLRQHIQNLISKEPDPQEYIAGRKLLDIDNPEGWKKIYKEEIYPSIEKIINQKKSEDIIDERIARKKKAALSGNSGGKPVQTKKKDDVNELSQKEMHEGYMQMRLKNKRAAV